MSAQRVHALAPHFAGWRALRVVWFLAWATLPPLLLLHEFGGVSLLWQAGGPEQAHAGRWLLIAVLPWVVGLELHNATAPLLSTPAGWLLPGLRRRLLAATAFVAAPLLLGAGYLASLSAAGESPGAGLAQAGAGVGIALLAFATGSVMTDGALPRARRWPPALLLLAAVVQPVRSLAFLDANPLLAGALAGVLAVVLASRQWARDTGRRRALLAPWSGGGIALPTAAPVATAASTEGLRAGYLLPWLQAAAFEGRTTMAIHLITGGMTATLAYIFNAPALVLAVAGSTLATRGTQFGGGLVYPLHRRQRHRLAFLGTVLDAVAFCTATGAWLAILHIVGVPRWEESASVVGWSSALALTFALAPVAQWAAVRRAAAGNGYHNVSIMRTFAPMLWFVLLALGSLLAIRLTGVGDDVAILLPAVLMLAVACWFLNWLAIGRLYGDGDLLVVTSSS